MQGSDIGDLRKLSVEQLINDVQTPVRLLTDLPATCTLLATGDHGIIQADNIIDLDCRSRLHRDVWMIGGEARARHSYLDRANALTEVMAVWTDELSTHASVVSREQALDEH